MGFAERGQKGWALLGFLGSFDGGSCFSCGWIWIETEKDCKKEKFGFVLFV